MGLERVGLAALVLLGVGCEPRVVVGSDEEKGPEPRGTPVEFTSVDGLRGRLLGRWLFCGGFQRYTGRAVQNTFYGGVGVDFWEESGTLRYAFLEWMGGYTRRSGDELSGTVSLLVAGGNARALLRAQDGVVVPWELDLFDGPVVLRNRAFDVWDFVPAP